MLTRSKFAASRAHSASRPAHRREKRRTTMEMLIILLALTTIAVPALTEFAVRFSQARDR
jgi:phosphatidylglycerophosphate synthase